MSRSLSSHLKYFGLFLALILVIWLLVALGLTRQAVLQAKSGRFSAAATTARHAERWLLPITPFPYLKTWPQALKLLHVAVECTPQLSAGATELSLPTCWKQLGLELAQLAQEPMPWPKPWRQILHQAAEYWTVIEPFTTGEHRVAVILQNNQELRAGGGFMGSLILLDLHDGRAATPEVLDIYEPDGQFTGRIEAPAGVAEYLSGGNGWRLPDANWAADGPTQAQDVLKLLALGGRQNIDLVVFINASLVESGLQLLGPVELPDYPQPVTADNLFEIARADRNTFFPGSYQKTVFLSQLATQLRLRLSQVSANEALQLWKTLMHGLESGDIWLYATSPEIQRDLETRHLSLSLPQVPEDSELNPVWLYSLESNVGINKANRHVTRQAELHLEQRQATLTLTFQNHHPEDVSQRQEYVNYHRVLLPQDSQLTAVSLNEQPLSQVDTQLITTSTGDQLLQAGFLVTVPEAKTTTLQVTWQLPTPLQPHLPLNLTIPRQPGLEPYPLTIHWQNQVETVVLDRSLINNSL